MTDIESYDLVRKERTLKRTKKLALETVFHLPFMVLRTASYTLGWLRGANVEPKFDSTSGSLKKIGCSSCPGCGISQHIALTDSVI